MFDLNIPGKVRLCESDYTIPGQRIAPPVDTPVGKVGMAIVSIDGGVGLGGGVRLCESDYTIPGQKSEDGYFKFI